MTSSNEQVLRVKLSDGRSFTGTHEHLMLTENGWQPIYGLKNGCKIIDQKDAIGYALKKSEGAFSWRKLRNSSGLAPGNIRETKKQVTTFAAPLPGKGCTARFTWRLAAQSRAVVTFITKIMTGLTTGLKILNCSRGRNTKKGIGPKIIPPRPILFERTCVEPPKRPKNGMGHLKVCNGIANTGLPLQLSGGLNWASANNAAWTSPVSSRCGFAQTLASLLSGENPARIMFSGNALCVVLDSLQTDIPKLKHVAGLAEENWPTVIGVEAAGVQPVFNLEVDDTHSFSINGGLVSHNCWDAVRYGLTPLIKRRNQARAVNLNIMAR
jgi:hypothetical protein